MVDLFVARIILLGNKKVLPRHTGSQKPMKTVFRGTAIAAVAVLALLTGSLIRAEPQKQVPSTPELNRSGNERGTRHSLWTGNCRNATYGANGRLKVYLIENGANLTGYISISGELVGSGDLKGTKHGGAVSFTSFDPIYNVPITWKGQQDGSRISGEYFIDAMPAQGTAKQVGEWDVALGAISNDGLPDSESGFKSLFLLKLEIDLNEPVQRPDGSYVTGAQALFDSIHPAGTGVSINVTSVEVEWNEGASRTKISNIRKYTVDYTIYWIGIIQKNGTTRMRLKYNTAIEAVTAHEVVSSTGITDNEAGQIAFSLGALLGRAAMKSLLSPN